MIDVSARIADRYRVDARLGGGGMADVFDAYDELLDRHVAVKLLRGIDDEAAARRFAEEIRLTARVNHPNIVRLFDAGEHEGSPYLVLERVSGGTLAAEMAAGPMDPQRVAAIGEQIASALSHSHAAGIVHRDVKPTNVLLTPDGDVRLADFGIAVTATATRLTVAGTVAGSAGYVSPEQVLGAGAGSASDVYSLGLVLLECLVGAPPWSGTTVEVALARITADPPIAATVPGEWASLLRAMTARNPDDRPHIDLVGLALSRLAEGSSLDSGVFAVAETLPDARVPVVAGMSLVVLLLSAFTVLTMQVSSEPAVAAAPVAVPNIRVAEAETAPVALLSPEAVDAAAPRTSNVPPRPQRTSPPAEQATAAASSGDTQTSASASQPSRPSSPTTTDTSTSTRPRRQTSSGSGDGSGGGSTTTQTEPKNSGQVKAQERRPSHATTTTSGPSLPKADLPAGLRAANALKNER